MNLATDFPPGRSKLILVGDLQTLVREYRPFRTLSSFFSANRRITLTSRDFHVPPWLPNQITVKADSVEGWGSLYRSTESRSNGNFLKACFKVNYLKFNLHFNMFDYSAVRWSVRAVLFAKPNITQESSSLYCRTLTVWNDENEKKLSSWKAQVSAYM